MVNKKCLITILLLQDYPQGYIHSFFYRPLLGLYLSLSNIAEFPLKPVYTTGWGKSSNLWFSSYWKMYLQLEKLHLHILTYATSQVKFSPRFLSLPQAQRNYSFFNGSIFSKIYFLPPGRKGEGGGRKLCHTQYEILKTTGKIVHLSTVQTKCFRSMQISAHPIKQC